MAVNHKFPHILSGPCFRFPNRLNYFRWWPDDSQMFQVKIKTARGKYLTIKRRLSVLKSPSAHQSSLARRLTDNLLTGIESRPFLASKKRWGNLSLSEKKYEQISYNAVEFLCPNPHLLLLNSSNNNVDRLCDRHRPFLLLLLLLVLLFKVVLHISFLPQTRRHAQHNK